VQEGTALLQDVKWLMTEIATQDVLLSQHVSDVMGLVDDRLRKLRKVAESFSPYHSKHTQQTGLPKEQPKYLQKRSPFGESLEQDELQEQLNFEFEHIVSNIQEVLLQGHEGNWD